MSSLPTKALAGCSRNPEKSDSQMIYEAFRDAGGKLFDTANFYTFLTPV
jgi:aryl-alcohol dehydrogenase-like predicted oxidoreductase